MGKLPLILILVFSTTLVSSQAPFGTLGAKWIFEGWSEGSGWQPNWEGNCSRNVITCTVTDEITIDGKTCGIITTNKNNDSLIVHQENDVVYFYEDSSFYKLFDYNAKKGDTIMSFRPSNAPSFTLYNYYNAIIESYLKVDTIYTIIIDSDSTIINGSVLRRWKTEALYLDQELNNYENYSIYETIIENIGSLNGILGHSGFFIGSGCYGGFVCYESDDFVFGSNFFPMCEFTSSVNQLDEPSIKVFPNPSNGIFNFEVTSTSINEIKIFDLNGRNLCTTHDNTVNLSRFRAGIYFAYIIDLENNLTVKKLVKQ